MHCGNCGAKGLTYRDTFDHYPALAECRRQSLDVRAWSIRIAIGVSLAAAIAAAVVVRMPSV